MELVSIVKIKDVNASSKEETIHIGEDYETFDKHEVKEAIAAAAMNIPTPLPNPNIPKHLTIEN
jgi:hypothetical protein